MWKVSRTCLIAAIFLSAIFIAAPTSAEKVTAVSNNVNWIGTKLHYKEVPDQELLPSDSPTCIRKTMVITGIQGSVTGVTADVCLHDKDGWSYGKYTYNYRTWYGSGATEQGWAVRLSGNGPMHRLTGCMVPDPIDVVGSNGVISWRSRGAGVINYYFDYYKDFTAGFHENVASNGEVTYTHTQTPDFILNTPDQTPIPFYNNPGISDNGKWAVVETGMGFLRINLDTLA